MTGLAATSVSPETASVRVERTTASAHFSAPLSVSKAVTSPEEYGTTTVLPETAGLAAESTPAVSGMPGYCQASVPSDWLTACNTLVALTTKTFPLAAVGAECAGALISKDQSLEPLAASSA